MVMVDLLLIQLIKLDLYVPRFGDIQYYKDWKCFFHVLLHYKLLSLCSPYIKAINIQLVSYSPSCTEIFIVLYVCMFVSAFCCRHYCIPLHIHTNLPTNMNTFFVQKNMHTFIIVPFQWK